MDWQQGVVIAAVALAAAYLVRRARSKKAGCGGCDECPAAAVPAAEEPALVQLQMTPPNGKSGRPG